MPDQSTGRTRRSSHLDEGGGRTRRHIVGLIAALPVAGVAGSMAASAAGQAVTGNERHVRGIDLLRRIGGPQFDGPINALARTSPDMARFTVEFPYGDVLSRDGLDLRARQICTVATLIAQGSSQPQLRFHMDGLLNAGGQPGDLVELMFLSTAVLGFPAAIDAAALVREIFRDRAIELPPAGAADDDGTDRYRRGVRAFAALMAGDAAERLSSLEALSAEFARWTMEFAYGDILARDGLEPKLRHLAIASMLAAQGNRQAALLDHLQGALKTGASRTEIIEVLIQLSVYAGFPAALNAFGAAATALGAPAPGSSDASAVPAEPSEHRTARRERGLAALARLSGASGEAVVESFDDIAPDIGRLIVDHSYGDIFHRPAIDMKTRELAACSALAARGSRSVETPLRVHVNAALNVGATREELVEVFLNLLPYCGYPAIEAALRIAGEEFARRGA